MKINKAIRHIMRTKGVSLSKMGSSLTKIERSSGEIKPLTGNDVSARLNNDNFSFNKAIEMLNVLGYEIVIQEKSQVNKHIGQIVIDQTEDKQDESVTPSNEEPIEKPKSTRKRIPLT